MEIIKKNLASNADLIQTTHSHPCYQLLILRNTKTVICNNHQTLIAPPQHAIWIPPHVEHQAGITTSSESYSIFLNEPLVMSSSSQFTLLELNPIFCRFLKHYQALVHTNAKQNRIERLKAVIRDEIACLKPVCTNLIMPQDPRVKRITDALLSDPSISHTLKTWGKKVGASDRTLQRIFEKETSLSFSEWRTNLRIERAKQLLRNDHSISETARLIGYDSQSAFSYAFRLKNHCTPSEYVASLNAHIS